jgi:hypothetical protein
MVLTAVTMKSILGCDAMQCSGGTEMLPSYHTHTVTEDGVFQWSRGQLAQTIMVLICIWEVTGLNCGHDTDYLE